MLINKQIQIVNKVANTVALLAPDYVDNKIAAEELAKLKQSLQDLADYLNQQIMDNSYATVEDLNSHIEAIKLHLDILKEVIDEKDYKKIANGIRLISTTLNFHPSKYTYWSFIKAWFLEWIYFI